MIGDVRKVWKVKRGSKLVTIPPELPLEEGDNVYWEIRDGMIILRRVELL